MSGEGAGIYFMVYKISNSGVQPTVRFGQATTAILLNNTAFLQLGMTSGLTTNTFTQQITRANATNGTFSVFTGLSTFDNPYANTINTLQATSSAFAGNGLGFILHTII